METNGVFSSRDLGSPSSPPYLQRRSGRDGSPPSERVPVPEGRRPVPPRLVLSSPLLKDVDSVGLLGVPTRFLYPKGDRLKEDFVSTSHGT